MKKIIFLIATVCVVISCTQVNSTSDKSITKGEDTLADVNVSLSKMDLVEELANVKDNDEVLFKASGSEPGWFAEFYNKKIRLVVDYGKDSVIIEHNNDGLTKKEDQKISLGKAGEILIQHKSCNAISGEVAERSVTVVYKSKQYQGCGSFNK